MYYHIYLTLKRPTNDSVIRLGYSLDQLRERVIDPYERGDSLVIDGRSIDVANIQQLRISQSTESADELLGIARAKEANDFVVVIPSVTDYSAWALGVEVTDSFIKAPPGTRTHVSQQSVVPPGGFDAFSLVQHICRRFHLVTTQIRRRHSNRETIEIADEYDVQDLLHALLRLFFDDVREEEYTPSYAGGSSRVDFLLKAESIVIEVKMTRNGLGAREVGDQLLLDIARYASHPSCKLLVCLVYDPEHRIKNPRGLEGDLSRNEDTLMVRVLVVPSGS